MNDGVTLSTFQIFQKFPDQETARSYLESRRWKAGVFCPGCASVSVKARKSGFFRCQDCKLDFTVRTGTIFERSHVPLHKWIYAMYLLVTARKGISSMQLSKQLSSGRVHAMPIAETDRETIHTEIYRRIRPGSTLHTDEAAAYHGLDGLFFRHEAVNHSAGEYRREDACTNGIESVWAVLKRGVHGVYHQISKKHTGRYVDEFAFRLNDGNVKTQTMDRLDAMISGAIGKRLTYEVLTA